MSLKDLFIKKQQYATVRPSVVRHNEPQEKPVIPSGMWVKCDKCSAMIYGEDLENTKHVCTICGHHFRINAKERVKIWQRNKKDRIHVESQISVRGETFSKSLALCDFMHNPFLTNFVLESKVFLFLHFLYLFSYALIYIFQKQS